MRHPPADLIIIDHNPTVRRLLCALVASSGLVTYAFEHLNALLAEAPEVAPSAVIIINLSGQPVLAENLRGRFPPQMIGQSPTLVVTSTHPELLPSPPSPESFDIVLPRPFRPSHFFDVLIRLSGAVATGRVHLTSPVDHPPPLPDDGDWSTVTALLRANQDLSAPLIEQDPDLPSVEIALDDELLAQGASASASPSKASASASSEAAFASVSGVHPLPSQQTPRPQASPSLPTSPTTGSSPRPSPSSNTVPPPRPPPQLNAMRVQGDLRLWPARHILRHLQRIGFHGTLTFHCQGLESSALAYVAVFLDGRIDLIDPLTPTPRRRLLPFLVEAGAVKAESIDTGRFAAALEDDPSALAQALVMHEVATGQQVLDAFIWQASSYLWDVFSATTGEFSLQALDPADIYSLLEHRPRLQLDVVLITIDFFRRSPQSMPAWRPMQGQRLYRNDGAAQLLAALPWPAEEQWLLAVLSEAPTFDGLMERALDDGIPTQLVAQALSRLYDFDVVSPVRLR
jgi:hypothetical protein